MINVITPIKKHSFLIVTLVVIGIFLSSVEKPGVYESQSRILFKLGEEFLQPSAGPNGRVAGRIELAQAVNTEIQILTSYDQLAQVVTQIGPQNFQHDVEQGQIVSIDDAVNNLRDNLNVRSVENSAVVHLSYTHADPVLVKNILSLVIEIYLREREKILVDDDQEVLRVAMNDAAAMYQSAQGELEEFVTRNNNQDIASTLEILRGQVARFSSMKYEVESQLLEDQHKIQMLNSEIQKQPAEKSVYSETRTNAATETARNRMIELQIEEGLLLGRFTPNSRAVTKVRKELDEIRKILGVSGDSTSVSIERTENNPVRDQLKLDRFNLSVRVAGATARMQSIRTQEEEIRRKIHDLEELLTIKRSLSDAMQLAQSRYRSIEDQYLNQKIVSETASARHSNVRVIESPTTPFNATGMPRLTRAILGAIVGFILGWIIALWIELLKQPRHISTTAHRNAEESEIYSLPVLGEFRRAS